MLCVDALFGQFYPDEVLKYVPKSYGVGLFAGHWRDKYGKFDKYVSALPLAKKLIAAGHPLIRIQILWSDDHRYGDNDLPIIRKEAQDYEQLAKANPHVEIQLSPFCEYGPLLRHIDYYCNVVANEAPHCLVIASPSAASGGEPSTKYRCERHGAENGKGIYQYSLDGSSAFDVDMPEVLEKHAKAVNFFLWIPQLNRKGKGGDTTPREKRIIKPTKEQFDLMYFQLTKRGKANLNSAYTYKSAADQAPKPAYPVAEDSRPVLIAPKDAEYSKADLLLASGQVIATMPYDEEQVNEETGQVVGQLYRMAGNEWGHKLAARVAAKQKQKVVRIRLGGKVIGTINPGFRQNKWRWD